MLLVSHVARIGEIRTGHAWNSFGRTAWKEDSIWLLKYILEKQSVTCVV